MWVPGTMLRLRNVQARLVGATPTDVDDEGCNVWPTYTYALVVAIKETGYGTRGKKFDALVVADGRVVHWVNAWREEDRIEVHG
jgi:hypothetical protein